MDVSESDYDATCTNSAIEEQDENEVANDAMAIEVPAVVPYEEVYVESIHCEIVTEIIDQDPTLTVGSRFYDYQSFENALNLYSLANNLVYTIQKSARISRRNKVRREKNYKLYNPKLKYSSLVMGCKHYGSKRSRTKGIRPKQSTYKTGCNSQIVLGFDSATQSLVVTRFITEHNHDVSVDMAENYPERRRLSMEETLFMEERLRNSDLKAKEVQAIFRTALHKHVSSKDVHNFRASLKRPRKEPPPVEEINEDEILKPGEPPVPPRVIGPKKPRVRKSKSNSLSNEESSETKTPRTKRNLGSRKAIKTPDPEDSDSMAGGGETQDYDDYQQGDEEATWENVETIGEAVILEPISIKQEVESGGEEEHYECIEYLEPDFAEDCAETSSEPQSISAVNDSWKCVYKLLEADNAALKRDVAKLREQVAALKQTQCANCGSTERK